MTTPDPKLEPHPYSLMFPPISGDDLIKLIEDIKKNGLQVPIKTFEAKILDGRSRYTACVELEKEGHPVEFKREYFTGDAKRCRRLCHQHERQASSSISLATCAYRCEAGNQHAWWRPVGKITD